MTDLRLIVESLASQQQESSAGDWVAIALVAGFFLFFLWLVVAAVRKKLASSSRRLAGYPEEQEEAARTARLWAEAKRRRKAEEEEEEAEEEEEEEQQRQAEQQQLPDIQQQLLEKAAERRRARKQAEQLAKEQREEKSTTEAPERRAEPVARQEAEEPVSEGLEPEAKPPAAAASGDEPRPAPAPEPEPKSLSEGLAKTRAGFVSRLGRLFGKASLDEDDIEQIEEILFTADIGVRTSQKLIDTLQQQASRSDKADPARLLDILKQQIESMLRVDAPAFDTERAKPFVILVVGVNGTGKTTTIGKLAMRFRKEGKKVVLAAADTFRAAAREQLEIWAERAQAQIVGGQEGADPGAVVFDAINSARKQGADIVIADTAGRLHTKVDLMEELKKVRRVC
ncbi:MAG: signal recognition particle-docking protein FtsY, partial [Deltaproteobacteria bacterium]